MDLLTSTVKYGVAAVVAAIMVASIFLLNPTSPGARFGVFIFWTLMGSFIVLLLLPDTVREFARKIGRKMYYDPAGITYDRDFSRVKKKIADRDYEDALALLESNLEEDPADWQSQLMIAEIYSEEQGKPEKAVRAYQICLFMEEEHEEVEIPEEKRISIHYRLADLFEKELAQPRRAIRELETLRDHLPDDHNVVPRASKRIERLRNR